MFRGALAQRRCIVDADAFCEWLVVESGNAIARTEGHFPSQHLGELLLAG
jgi:putative SOS response-associated peptidase YedK